MCPMPIWALPMVQRPCTICNSLNCRDIRQIKCERCDEPDPCARNLLFKFEASRMVPMDLCIKCVRNGVNDTFDSDLTVLTIDRFNISYIIHSKQVSLRPTFAHAIFAFPENSNHSLRISVLILLIKTI